MNSYEFRVSLFGNVKLEVLAESREQANEMVKDLMENIEVKNIKLQETKREDITITDSDLKMNISSKFRDLEVER